MPILKKHEINEDKHKYLKFTTLLIFLILFFNIKHSSEM